ncbi:MAG: bifunctional folylpolyglutamate synthase/dihydrofolate synthase [Gloeomargaritaceae cyanobacterium C42_A2020_066]|nr:bifunctional folylpolyglutamate synthase/dihydrofolate synthase [Gloeomargaritaceae cyanobacterium C42_A2020_066]
MDFCPEAFLAKLNTFGVDLGLERVERLLAALGRPHLQVPILHIAGSNGKGSVCAYLSSVLTACGYRVGRYTSPHLVDYRERICLNEAWITAADWQRCLEQVAVAIDQGCPATQFEAITAAAWLYFAQERVDLAVIEVGLGGRLDATNVCAAPLVTAITSLSLEHQDRLGPTLQHIAYEKAGILKPGRPLVLAPVPPEAEAVVRQRADALDCPVIPVIPAEPAGRGRGTWGGLTFDLGLTGPHQLVNAATALTILRQLETQGWVIPMQAIVQGLSQVNWPGRLQWVTWHGRPLLVDGAHNPEAALALRQALTESHPGPVHWVIGMLATKNHREVLAALLCPGDALSVVPVPDHASADPEALGALVENLGVALSQCQPYPTLEAALAEPPRCDLQVLCGSLYLIGYALGQMGSAPGSVLHPLASGG